MIDRVSQLIERQTQDPKTRGSNSELWVWDKKLSFSESKLLCWLVVGVPTSPRVYVRTHKNYQCQSCYMHVKGPRSVDVLSITMSVWWITETQKHPAYTCRTG